MYLFDLCCTLLLLLLALGMAPPEVNWTVEIVRICATGGIALLGAWIGFGLANRGRKYDLLYKERFSSFKIICDDMVHLRNILMSIHVALDKFTVLHSSSTEGQEVDRKYLSLQKELSLHIEKMERDKKELIFMSSETRVGYKTIFNNSVRIYSLCEDYRDFSLGNYDSSFAPRKNALENLEGVLDFTENLVVIVVNHELRNQGIPESKELFDYDTDKDIELARRQFHTLKK